MGFFKALIEFFESIFMGSSPEVKRKVELKKIENELKSEPSQIFKGGVLQPNCAELFRVLYENVKPIEEILSKTIKTDDIHRRTLFENELVITGFDAQTQEKIENLSYENRKKVIMESDLPINKVIESQKHTMESILRQIKSPVFMKIDETISCLNQLADICEFNYSTVIRAFAPNFDGITSNVLGVVSSVAPGALETQLQDLYYISAHFKIDSSEARAVFALKKLLSEKDADDAARERIFKSLGKINSVFTKYISSDVLKKIICLAKREPDVALQTASYHSSALKNFIEYFQKTFAMDSDRIKSEMRDYTVSFELKELFGGRPLDECKVYNNETNEFLRKNSPFSFMWITPLQIIKTFLAVFMTNPIKTLLNNIVIEGFFNNQEYKSEFSSVVFACNEIDAGIVEFEKTFERGEANDEAELLGLVRDGRKDSDFLKKVGVMVDNINNQAHKIVQEKTKVLYNLYVQIGELLIDAKKAKSAVVSNIKVLFASSRNKDASSAIEQQYESWKLFLNIMKNYAIIGEVEKRE